MAFRITQNYAFRNYIVPDSSGIANGTTGNDDIFATGDGQTLYGNGGDDIFHLGTYSNVNIVVPDDGVSISEVSTYAARYVLPQGVDNLAAAGDYSHTLIGNEGDNVIIGAGGDDILMSGGGSDWLLGGAGNDILYGGPAFQTMDGGAGSDEFIITAGQGNQDIQNFQAGTGGDVINLINYGFTSFTQVRAAMTEETAPDGTVHGTFLHLPTGETLLLDGFDINHPFSDTSGPIPDQFTADNFFFNGTASSATESQHTLSVFLSEDAFQGDAQFTLDVDGVQILGPTSVVVKHGDGFQTFTFTGDMPDSPHSVDIHFINDAYGGSSGEDRNLYVGGIQFDQFSMQGNEASDNAAGGHQADDPNAAVMHIDGTTSFADVAVNGTPGQLPPDSVAMTLHLSEDAYQGDAQFTVDVDGQQVIGPTSVEVAHNSGGNQDFTAFLQQFGQGAHTISINFINDAYGGSSNADRNLYVESIDINGVNFAGNTAADNAAGGHQADDPTGAVMHTNGTVTFTIDEAQPIHSTAPPEIMG